MKESKQGNLHAGPVARKGYHTRSIGAGGNVRWEGHDLLGVLTISDDSAESQDIITFQVNPSTMGFKALAKECQLHQQYKFSKFEVHVPGTASSFVNGDGMGYFTRDVNQTPEGGLDGLQVGWYLGGEQCTFKNGKTFRMPHFPNLPNLYCQDLDSDKRLVNQCIFNFKVVNPPSTYSSGPSEGQVDLRVEFWASYVCDFFVKGLVDNVLSEPQFTIVQTDNPHEGEWSANDPMGWHGPTFLSTLNIPPSSKGYIPGLFVGTKALPAAKDGKTPNDVTGCDVFGIAAGYGLDTACGWHVGVVTEAQSAFSNGFPIKLHPYMINCTHDFAVGMNYTSAASNVCGTFVLQVDVPGATQEVFMPEGYWLCDETGSWDFYGAIGENLEVVWMSSFKWNASEGSFDEKEMANTHLLVSMACSDDGPALAAWAGDATVEGKAWRAWTGLAGTERSAVKFKDFLKKFRELRRPPKTDTEDQKKLAELVEEVKEHKISPLLYVRQSTDESDSELIEMQPAVLKRTSTVRHSDVRSQPPTPPPSKEERKKNSAK
jgi:hypothetical protein